MSSKQHWLVTRIERDKYQKTGQLWHQQVTEIQSRLTASCNNASVHNNTKFDDKN